MAIHCRNLPVSRMSDFDTEFPWLLLANAGFTIAIDDTRIATVAIASIAKVVVVVLQCNIAAT